MGSNYTLVVQGPTYYSPGDEKAFFDWLHSIPCVAGVRGQIRDLHITIKGNPSPDDIGELRALLGRYKMPTDGLEALKSSSI